MKNILVIDGFVPVHLKLKEMGAKLSIITETGRIKGKYPDLYFRAIQVPDEDKLFFANKLNELEKIDCILNCSENRQYITSKIASDLNLKYHSIDVLDRIYDKNIMREYLREVGLDKTKSLIVNSKEDILYFIEMVGLPVVIKPKDGIGSKGVSIIYDLSEIDSALDWYKESNSELNSLYIEEYIDGVEYSVESFLENGESKIVSITQKIKTTDNHCIEMGHCVGNFLDNDTRANIEEYVKKIMKLIGIENGPCHTEIIVKSNGEIGIVETHCRLGGDCIPNLVNNAFGIDMVELWAKQVLGDNILDKLNATKNRYSSIYFIDAQKSGILKSIPSLDKYYDKYGEDIEFKFYKNEGETISKLKDSYSRLGHVILTRDDKNVIDDVKNIVKEIEGDIVIGE